MAFFWITWGILEILNNIVLAIMPYTGHNFQPEAIEIINLLKPIGYFFFISCCILIITSFLYKKKNIQNLGKLGVLSLIIPIFANYTSYMFILAGSAILRIVWLPFMDINNLLQGIFGEQYNSTHMYLDMFSLGWIVVSPIYELEYNIARTLGTTFTTHSLFQDIISNSLFLLGLVIFIFSTFTWFYGKIKNKELIDFWIYNYSRHPQYLGFILSSYGLLYGSIQTFALRGSYYPIPSFPWILGVLVLIGISMNEEISLEKGDLEGYCEWKDSTPFLLPLPLVIKRIVLLPAKIIVKKEFPTNRYEILIILLIYGIILVIIPWFVLGFFMNYMLGI